ncbi:MAG: trigger factor [Gracilimonas sp.]|uniref:trigger factor n=1 Tax=Gracilimonas TaxID=649462 RepID=UPI001B00CC84|nr:trigger factor [Gracilimonas sp.]MBO6585000.1 trigger factor [Gracilimonas sp.]MBO6615729.1 trigger factor [Gracilimonas sp.]
MDISVEELTSVDKEVTLKAKREDLQEDFDKAYKKYKDQIQLPGFRPGKVPMGLVKKRFGKEIEQEEISNIIQKVFEKEVVPEYEPVGETEMVDFTWENDELEVKFKIGSKPEIEVADLSKIEVNKMVHDVTDEEVEEEVERTLEREGNWEDVDEAASEETQVLVDVVSKTHGDEDKDQRIDLRKDDASEFLEALKGKKAGDVVEMTIPHGDHEDELEITLKKVQKMHKAELTDDIIKDQSNGEAENLDEFKSYIKSRMQQYYDQTSDDLFKNDVADALVEAHDFEVPETFVAQIQGSYVDQLKQQQGGELPDHFDAEEYKAGMKDRAVREAKWSFISQKLQETFEDIEIKPEDIDEHLAGQAAQYGMPVDQLKQYYAQQPQMLEQLRSSIREEKVFDILQDKVKTKEISKEKYREQQEKKDDKKKKK